MVTHDLTQQLRAHDLWNRFDISIVSFHLALYPPTQARLRSWEVHVQTLFKFAALRRVVTVKMGADCIGITHEIGLVLSSVANMVFRPVNDFFTRVELSGRHCRRGRKDTTRSTGSLRVDSVVDQTFDGHVEGGCALVHRHWFHLLDVPGAQLVT